MKNLITSLALLMTLMGFSQNQDINGLVVKETTKVSNVSVTVTVDSAEDIASKFKITDIREALELSDANEIISFKIICNGKYMTNDVKSHVTYKVEGNSNNIEGFLKSVDLVRTAAIKYYKNKD